MKLLSLVLAGCFIVYGAAQRVPIGGPGFGDPTPPGGGGFNTLPALVGGGGATTLPATIGGGGGGGLASILPAILSFFRGKRDLQGVHPVTHSRTRRSPQRFISGFFLRPFSRPSGRPPPSFFRPQVSPGGPPPNVVGPGGTQFG